MIRWKANLRKGRFLFALQFKRIAFLAWPGGCSSAGTGEMLPIIHWLKGYGVVEVTWYWMCSIEYFV
jgi:hypothetical protein